MREGKFLFFILLILVVSACSQDATVQEKPGIPENIPSVEDLDPDDPMTPYIKYGEDIFNETATVLPERTGNKMSCASCHADGGVSNTISMVGVTTNYPAYRPRENTIFTIEDRINGCMKRSMDGEALEFESEEMRAITAYLTHISEDIKKDDTEWLGLDSMEEIPEPDVDRGEDLYVEKNCMSCHATDGSGKGMTSGPPLWGDDSFNDGAGMNRLSNAAGFIQEYMPRYDPGSLTDQEAADIAAFLLSQERPVWEGHDEDWEEGGRPPDIITQERREQIRNGTFDWTELDNVVPEKKYDYEK
ncbi:c-type cytochrome [Virgibacillus sp. NKC19-3]|uniref:c-type cytochrome n=1 Tax=Virgibacillus saliphilus TaxID=2831674 RepID=UPI001C9B42BA|nr:c-type cytochrome [Virgibacillus sp. NKC19-3]MBY7142490.1 c-type cytochrome [Virgibacillus sp. NKC19-3]